MNPLISFIITNYNLPFRLLGEAIGSVLALDMKPEEREILLVDDGSSAENVSLLLTELRRQGYDRHVTLLQKENGGTASARNFGIAKAHGRYIQFIDGDDSLIPSNYNDIVRYLRLHDVEGVYFEFSLNSQDFNHDSSFTLSSGSAYMLHNNIKGIAWLLLVSTDIARQCLFDTSKYQEDELFIPQVLLRIERLAYSPLTAYYYRQIENSKSNIMTPETIRLRNEDLLSVILELRSLSATLAGLQRRALERRVDQLSMDYLYRHIKELPSQQDTEYGARRLAEHKLFPLPLHAYTWKYLLFSILMNHRLSRLFISSLIKRII